MSTRKFPSIQLPVAILLAGLVVRAFGQDVPSISISKDKNGEATAFVAGYFTMPDMSRIETSAFIYTPIKSFKNGDKVAVMMSHDQAWSADKLPLHLDSGQINYPIFAAVKSHAVMPGTLRIKTDLKAGSPQRIQGYQIETSRQIKTGDMIPVLLIGDSMLSVVAIDNTKKSEPKPWFVAYKENVTVADRADLVKAWRVVNEHASR